MTETEKRELTTDSTSRISENTKSCQQLLVISYQSTRYAPMNY